MRAVVDTNILIRALIKPKGTVAPVLRHLREGAYTALYSTEVLEEISDVLGRARFHLKYGIQDEDVGTLLSLIVLRGEKVVPLQKIQICRDPKDDMMLELAVNGRADLIVSGDKDLLVLNPFQSIPIVGASEFLKRLEEIR